MRPKSCKIKCVETEAWSKIFTVQRLKSVMKSNMVWCGNDEFNGIVRISLSIREHSSTGTCDCQSVFMRNSSIG